MQLESLTRAATDLTLFFGAESFIHQCRGGAVFDPDGESCLAVLIDLIVNCTSLGLTLPGTKQHNQSKLIPLLKEYFVELPDGMLPLLSETEDAVAREFVVYANARDWKWFSQWATFQLTSPIVTTGHNLRLGGNVVSPEGVQAWRNRAQEIAHALDWPPLILPNLLPEFMHNQFQGLSPLEFPLCYAFDVYRRGWQYVERVRQLKNGSAYVPHSLRKNCLSKTATWTPIEFRQEYLWSWGKYICAVLHDDHLAHYRSPAAVVDMVNSIKRVMSQQGGCPTWDASRVIDDCGNIVDLSYLKEIQKRVMECAQEAKLPQLPRPNAVREAAGEMAGVAKDAVMTLIEGALDLTIGLPIELTKIVGKVVAPDVVAQVETITETKKRELQSLLFHASLEYGPLVPTP